MKMLPCADLSKATSSSRCSDNSANESGSAPRNWMCMPTVFFAGAGKLGVVGDEHRLLVVSVDGERVVRDFIQVGRKCCPALVASLRQETDEPCINVVVEKEPHAVAM
jgi:hypothetical protein